MRRRYVPMRTRTARRAVRIISPRVASERFVPIFDEDTCIESSEVEDWLDAQTEADALLAAVGIARRWH